MKLIVDRLLREVENHASQESQDDKKKQHW